MFPDSSGVTTPPSPIASRPQEDEAVDGTVNGGRPSPRSSSETGSVKSPEPHWDSVIGAATD